jgi:2-amino-4-hydroxy-6-hydroxymethyldihydropteridine diphosphokinase
VSVVSYIGLGSNLGDRMYYLREAIKRLEDTDGITCIAVSNVYETEPVGYTKQGKFLNLVLAVRVEIGPFELLNIVLDIEKKLGRERNIRFGPRTIDLDILTYGNIQIDADRLVVPHPRLHERAFVLKPLLDIDQNWIHPVLGIDIHTLWNEHSGERGVTLCSMELAREFAHIVSSNI